MQSPQELEMKITVSGLSGPENHVRSKLEKELEKFPAATYVPVHGFAAKKTIPSIADKK
jgi:hypothetical protein